MDNKSQRLTVEYRVAVKKLNDKKKKKRKRLISYTCTYVAWCISEGTRQVGTGWQKEDDRWKSIFPIISFPDTSLQFNPRNRRKKRRRRRRRRRKEVSPSRATRNEDGAILFCSIRKRLANSKGAPSRGIQLRSERRNNTTKCFVTGEKGNGGEWARRGAVFKNVFLLLFPLFLSFKAIKRGRTETRQRDRREVVSPS